MGKWTCNLIVLTLLFAAPALAETTYDYVVSDIGETQAEIQRDTGTPIVLPDDVSPTESTRISYTSLYHTRKEQGVWYFETTILRADTITLTLPQSVHVVQSIPVATFTKTNVWQLTWTNMSGNISVSYVSTKPVSALPVQIPLTLPTLPVVIILVMIAIAAYSYSRKNQQKEKRKQKTPHEKKTDEPNVTEAQLNILRAANTNEALVIRTILAHNGHMKRNILERETKLSKSSLASTLKNLEHKNIVTIDRTFFVHYIGLTPWFKEL